MFNKITFLIYESIFNLFRSGFSVLISSFTIAATLLFISVSYYGYSNMIGYSYDFKKQYRVDVFFDYQFDDSTSIAIHNKILTVGGIESGLFIDKVESARIFSSLYDEDIEEILGMNPLPFGGKYQVEEPYRSPVFMNRIVQEIKTIPGVEDVAYQQGLVSKIDKLTENLFSISVFIFLGIFIVSAIITSNTLRLIIHARSDTINILHQLGATNTFIQAPFLLEGIYQGLIGAGISVFSIFLLDSILNYLFDPVLILAIPNVKILVASNLAMGGLLGFTGSYRAVLKYVN